MYSTSKKGCRKRTTFYNRSCAFPRVRDVRRNGVVSQLQVYSNSNIAIQYGQHCPFTACVYTGPAAWWSRNFALKSINTEFCVMSRARENVAIHTVVALSIFKQPIINTQSMVPKQHAIIKTRTNRVPRAPASRVWRQTCRRHASRTMYDRRFGRLVRASVPWHKQKKIVGKNTKRLPDQTTFLFVNTINISITIILSIITIDTTNNIKQ